MIKKKVVLYFPRVFSDTRPWHGTPLALLSISGLLVKEGYDVRIISDFLFKKHIDEVVRQCEDSICLGLTCMTGFQIYDGLRIADIVRAARPDLPIVWGGWHPSILPQETARDGRVDVVIQGQGERKFAEVVRRLAARAPLDGIPGVTYKNNDGSLTSSPDSAMEDLNLFPPYPYHLVQVDKCLDVTEYGQRTIHYMSSQGCPHNCGFCIEPVVNRRRWIGLSAERVLADWEHLYTSYGIDSIAIYDSNFFVDKKRVYDICTGLLKKNIRIKWGNANGNISRLITYEPAVWEAMERSGCQMVLTGVESGSQEALDMIEKNLTLDQIEKFSDLCRRYHVRIFGSFITGLPWSVSEKENEKKVNEELDCTIRQIATMMKYGRGNRFSISIYTPYPGSRLYDKALSLGFQAPRSFAEWSTFLAVAEDAFQIDTRRRWITRTQSLRVSMLTQYIFGLMDIPTRDRIASKMTNPVTRFAFICCWNIGLMTARLRWKCRFWAIPVDFWIYTQVRKYLKLF